MARVIALWSGIAVLAALLVVIGVEERPRGHHHRARADRAKLQALLGPGFAQEEIVRRAKAILVEAGGKVDGLYAPVSLEVDPEYARFADRAASEIAAFAERGAPVLFWYVSLYHPQTWLVREEEWRVCIDTAGRICGLEHSRREPEALRWGPRQDWVERAKARALRFMGLEGAPLRRLSQLERVDVGMARLAAAWELVGVHLGDAKVAMGVSERDGVLEFGRRILTPASAEARPGRGHAYDGAILVALVLAVLFGVQRRSADRAAAGRLARRTRFAALALAAGLCILEVVGLGATEPLFSVGFAVAAAFLAALAVIEARGRGADTAPGRFVRWALFACVPLAFVGAFAGCAGDGSLFSGCTRFCTLARVTAIPLGVLALFLSVLRDEPALHAPALVFFAMPLLPHCVCDNFANHAWIEWLGRSPMCFFAGFAVAGVAMAGLRGNFPRTALTVMLVAVAVVGALAVGHQLFKFPW